MAVITSLLLLLALHQTSADSVTDGTELLLSFMVHRHGDRTPLESFMTYAVDSDKLENLVAPWGYGQLTDNGRRTGYKTGQFIRRRYDELLSETYNKSEIYIRSTDSTRTKMTVLCAMAAVYPAVGDTWSNDINWVPVPYKTVPVLIDFNVASLNCPVLAAGLTPLSTAPSSRMDEFEDVLVKLSNITGFDLTSSPTVMAFTFYDLFVSELSLGMDISEEIMTLMPRLEEAAAVAVDVMWGDEKYIGFQAGAFLNEFFDAAASVIAGDEIERVRVYSAHDFNVYSLQAVTGVNRQLSKYGSLYSLELRRVTATGQYVVLPVYLPSPYLSEFYLTVENCGGEHLCDFDTFSKLTAKYVMDEDTWRKSCGWSADMTFDTSSID